MTSIILLLLVAFVKNVVVDHWTTILGGFITACGVIGVYATDTP